MASVGPLEHKRFCKIDGWQELKSAGEKQRDHEYYEKRLPNGGILRTKVSRNKKEYGTDFWNRIWREQLGLESEDQFWEALQSKEAVARERQVDPPKGPRIPGWLVQRLTQTAGLRWEEISGLSPGEALERWEKFQRGD